MNVPITPAEIKALLEGNMIAEAAALLESFRLQEAMEGRQAKDNPEFVQIEGVLNTINLLEPQKKENSQECRAQAKALLESTKSQ